MADRMSDYLAVQGGSEVRRSPGRTITSDRRYAQLFPRVFRVNLLFTTPAGSLLSANSLAFRCSEFLYVGIRMAPPPQLRRI
jgi:hypothetical protein